jgi:hypothetical protein
MPTAVADRFPLHESIDGKPGGVVLEAGARRQRAPLARGGTANFELVREPRRHGRHRRFLVRMRASIRRDCLQIMNANLDARDFDVGGRGPVGVARSADNLPVRRFATSVPRKAACRTSITCAIIYCSHGCTCASAGFLLRLPLLLARKIRWAIA